MLVCVRFRILAFEIMLGAQRACSHGHFITDLEQGGRADAVVRNTIDDAALFILVYCLVHACERREAERLKVSHREGEIGARRY
jgi:hypothetical protein